MKRIGLLGGMSWEPTIEYYRLVNELVAQQLGGLHSADCLLRSVDFTEIEVLGCTEIDLLVGSGDSPVPVFDTTRLHAERTVALSLA